MTATELQVTRREGLGKGAARKLRATGQVPGIVYGHKEQPTPISLDPKAFFKGLRSSGMGRNTLFHLRGLDRDVTCLVREMQLDPVRRDLRHLDLQEVRDGDEVVAEVPVKTTGRAAGVVAGGDLALTKRTLTIKATPVRIPKEFVIDVTSMGLNATVRVSDVPMPDGVLSIESPRLAVVTVKESRRSRQQAAAEATEGDG
jgi:large subunit ribosomal protein L25